MKTQNQALFIIMQVTKYKYFTQYNNNLFKEYVILLNDLFFLISLFICIDIHKLILSSYSLIIQHIKLQHTKCNKVLQYLIYYIFKFLEVSREYDNNIADNIVIRLPLHISFLA